MAEQAVGPLDLHAKRSLPVVADGHLPGGAGIVKGGQHSIGGRPEAALAEGQPAVVGVAEQADSDGVGDAGDAGVELIARVLGAAAERGRAARIVLDDERRTVGWRGGLSEDTVGEAGGPRGCDGALAQ